LIAELVETNKRREALSLEERNVEDAESKQLQVDFTDIMNTMDQQQKQIIIRDLAQMMPSGRLAFMKKLVEGGEEAVLPPSKEEITDWKGVYLSYFDSRYSSAKGRVMPLKYCVPNPRPDEITGALSKHKFKNIFEATKRRPTDSDW